MLKHKGKEAVNSLYFCIILPFCDAINLYRKIRDTFRKIGIQLYFFFLFFFFSSTLQQTFRYVFQTGKNERDADVIFKRGSNKYFF